MTAPIDDLSAELLRLQKFTYAFECEGAFTMNNREAAQLRTELADRKAHLLMELDAALMLTDVSHTTERDEMRYDFDEAAQ